MTENASRGPSLSTWIMLGLVVWGGYLAVGSYLHGQTLHWQRAAIVFGMTVLFAGFWMLMLAVRKRRLRAKRKKNEDSRGSSRCRAICQETVSGRELDPPYFFRQFSFSSGMRSSSTMRPLTMVSSTIRGTSSIRTPPYQIACG